MLSLGRRHGLRAKVPGAPHALPHVLFALATVAGAWLLLPTLFALTYASAFYAPAVPDGFRRLPMWEEPIAVLAPFRRR